MFETLEIAAGICLAYGLIVYGKRFYQKAFVEQDNRYIYSGLIALFVLGLGYWLYSWEMQAEASNRFRDRWVVSGHSARELDDPITQFGFDGKASK